MKPPKKPLDPVVKLGLGVLLGSFLLIGIGMVLSRPDRSIPPYSVGSQEDGIVAVHLPAWTSDPEIETLIRRFRKVGRGTRDFGPMKIRPTTPDDPKGQYHYLTIYIFSDHHWAAPEVLHRYLILSTGGPEEEAFKRDFEQTVRGGYILEDRRDRGWLGPISPPGADTSSHLIQVLFDSAFNEEHFALADAPRL